MEKLKKKHEYYKYLNIILLGLYMVYMILVIVLDGKWSEMCSDFLLFIVLEGILLTLWYPKEYQKKKAEKDGIAYQGKIVDIRVKDADANGLFGRRYNYALFVEFEMDGKRIEWEDCGYTENAFDYIPVNRICNVYVYKGRYFLQDFYKGGFVRDNSQKHELEYTMEILPFLNKKEVSKAVAEWMQYQDVCSQEKLILMPKVFNLSDEQLQKTLFIEVRMKSEKEYTVSDFSLTEKIDKYIDDIKNKYMLTDETRIYREINELVRETILQVDNEVEIKEVCVILK